MESKHHAPYLDLAQLNFEKQDNFDIEVLICESLIDYCAQHNIVTECISNELHFINLDIVLRPTIMQLNSQSVLLCFELTSEQWDKSIIENSAGMGVDTAQALANALESFSSACLEGLLYMLSEQSCYESCTSTFMGHEHKWQVYLSDLVSIGEAPDIEEAQYYWDELKEMLLPRLGNQRFCYIKVFASKSFGSVFCECRIDNVLSNDVTQLLVKMTKHWSTQKFASHKMFFFLKQDENTVLPSDLFLPPKQKELNYQVNVALRLFGQCSSQEEYEQLPLQLQEIIPDKVLALELYYFLPEICTQMMLPEISFSDAISLSIGDNEPINIHIHQLTDYLPIYRALTNLMTDNPSDELKEAFKLCSFYSSAFNVINQVLNESPETKLTDLSGLTTCYFVPPSFEIR
ncbi:DUF6348 family protein [Anaerobiospirillum sp. NML120448]|uniref:DUF6348 family protein n=1 Tax=Anaerobiospirillum sp. NML120448 TaxID=2932816 RepID=UPI001FF12F6F|nr:DUF6348 family protein [Anaerobiospirillum sp. NML120448]MCK0515397.1 DUF6348 family protein [Anaerobiospirillum sp. NML120448]